MFQARTKDGTDKTMMTGAFEIVIVIQEGTMIMVEETAVVLEGDLREIGSRLNLPIHHI